MRFLADENFPRPAVEALRRSELDVTWISEGYSGSTDEMVLEHCGSERRTLLTFDKDFGELAFLRGLPADCGIILFRVEPWSPEELAAIAVEVLLSHMNWASHFSVVTRDRVRMRPLPNKKSEFLG
jgi:predicted nuclease of predicted toxin-antitoxin system